MQKIMFNDRYGLTKAVLDGKKTQTRRLALNAEDTQVFNLYPEDEFIRKYVKDRYSRYSIGETLAVAQCLKDLGYDANDRSGGAIWGLDHTAAWNNKMFISAKQCKHQIRITGIRLERLQDISDEDCMKEGIRPWNEAEETDPRVRQSLAEIKAAGVTPYQITGHWDCYSSPREAFASLIDKVSGKGTWEKNPWVFVYDFELMK